MKEGTMWIELVSNTSQSKATKIKRKRREKKKKKKKKLIFEKKHNTTHKMLRADKDKKK